MSKAKAKAKGVVQRQVAVETGSLSEQAQLLAMPAVNGAAVIEGYAQNILGVEPDIAMLADRLQSSADQVNKGDLGNLEAMLVSQATALQTIFTSLALRAQVQKYQRQYESYLSLALKAQAQSRATISALAELKYPRQSTFVRQANIANGPQQVNNCVAPSVAARASENRLEKNELLAGKEAIHGRKTLDYRTTQSPSGEDSAVAPVVAIDRAYRLSAPIEI